MRIVSKLPNIWKRGATKVAETKKGWVELQVKGNGVVSKKLVQKGKAPVQKGKQPLPNNKAKTPASTPRPIETQGKKTHWVMMVIVAVLILGGVAAFFLLGDGQFVGQAVKFQEEKTLSLDVNTGGFIVLADAEDSFLEIDSSQKFPVYANVGEKTGKVFEATITLDPSIKTLSADAWATSPGTIFEQKTNADGTLYIAGAFLDGFTGKIKLFDIELQGKTEKDAGTIKIDLSVYEDKDAITDLITTDVAGSFKVGAPKKEVTGCIDLKATNYNKLATKDDGSCTFECTKSEECSDYALAGTCTDNKCVYCKDDKYCIDNPTAGGQYCTDGKCVMCSTDQQCVDGKLGKFCASGQCQQCKVNADCGSGTCSVGTCSYSCKDDKECAPGTCMKPGGIVEGTCMAPDNYKGTIKSGEKCDMKKSFECVEGSWCENGVCSTPAESCTTGNLQCVGKDVQQCTAGAWSTKETCTDSCESGVCVKKITCTDGVFKCVGTVLNICESNGWNQKEICKGTCDEKLGCVAENLCGNSKLDAGEECDGALLNAQTCASKGFEKGVLKCTSTCKLDTLTCVAKAALTCTPTCPAGATCTAGACACATGTYDEAKNECVTTKGKFDDAIKIVDGDSNGCLALNEFNSLQTKFRKKLNGADKAIDSSGFNSLRTKFRKKLDGVRC
jgi:hypothetical protein